jgi:hypothetical protein
MSFSHIYDAFFPRLMPLSIFHFFLYFMSFSHIPHVFPCLMSFPNIPCLSLYYVTGSQRR